jgi:hypothetical protein
MIDDFEDNDGEAFRLFPGDPKPSWYIFNDGTGTQPEFIGPGSPGAGSSLHAAHTAGSGFTTWGAGLSLTLNTHQEACSADLSQARGLRFKAKGQGNVELSLTTSSSASPANGGHCMLASGCDFSPFHQLELTADWKEFVVPWEEVEPGSVAFDPSEVLFIQFHAKDASFPPTQPIEFDFWIDDVELYDDSGAGGAGGAGF